MGAYTIETWSDFAVAHAGAAAVLIGLVFVALSINLRDIVASQALLDRAIESIVLFGIVLVSSTFVLIPGQEQGVLAGELIALAVVGAAVVHRLHRTARQAKAGRTARLSRQALGLAPPALFLVAGITLAAETVGGLYWWLGAVLLAYFGALTGAWVLLVEVLR